MCEYTNKFLYSKLYTNLFSSMTKLEQLNDLYEELRAAGRVHNKSQLAELVGLNKSTLSSAFNGNPKYLTESLLSRITALTIADEGKADAMRVPLIPVEAHAGSLTDFAESVKDYDCESIVSPVRGASFAIQVTGDSMSPAYPSGARILCQRIDEAAFIEWGKVYLLDTVNGAVLKQVRKADTPDRVVCCSLNPSPEYAPFEIETRHINAWFRVLMIMSLV